MEELHTNNEWEADDTEGQLAIDVYQDDHSIYILAPIAGVSGSDIDVSITDEVITIRGERKPGHDSPEEKHFNQECYWGPFSRSYVMPIAVNSEDSKATLKDGMLKIQVPKDAKVKTKTIKINDK
ncbi:MAG: Hsp20/alpha crystallin family protein [Candidatus Woesebacteria bacterium]|nr:Hsp20/alpha crystallin family protein [Candidatus Woesebacteria bacterium]